MSDTNTQPTPHKSSGWLEPGPSNIQLIYILYLVSFVIGISALVGVVLAYINRGKSEAWVETHYTWAIRTFWIGILYAVISALLTVVLIGFLLLLLTAIWVVVRMVIGLQAVSRGEPIRNPQSWVL
ncbi:hypothetical protein NYR54_07975 [Chelativorans sp. SCAU2101]|jgi:Predicted membrane protein|uniref:Transmembrane protein n=1 Tax=Chelativorans petroleitrophicus TaxID=2975484 RepID=A0A9X3B6D6_9HYPH|nr:DUF4870 domain-containing protein [Chelativorans petroleitrophicus]MCT8990232.1 hypothetical protein [Chelativorans petroleitrophicus]